MDAAVIGKRPRDGVVPPPRGPMHEEVNPMLQDKIRTDEFKLTGEDVIAQVKQLVHEGNVRRIILRNEAGHTVAEFPLTIGVFGAVLLPVWAALGAIAALASNLTIVVERRD